MKINFILIEKQTPQYPSVLIASESCISHAKIHLGEFLSGLDRKKHLSQENTHILTTMYPFQQFQMVSSFTIQMASPSKN